MLHFSGWIFISPSPSSAHNLVLVLASSEAVFDNPKNRTHLGKFFFGASLDFSWVAMMGRLIESSNNGDFVPNDRITETTVRIQTLVLIHQSGKVSGDWSQEQNWKHCRMIRMFIRMGLAQSIGQSKYQRNKSEGNSVIVWRVEEGMTVMPLPAHGSGMWSLLSGGRCIGHRMQQYAVRSIFDADPEVFRWSQGLRKVL